MKLGAMKDALPGSLGRADRVFCYAANLGWDVAARAGAARRAGPRCTTTSTRSSPRSSPTARPGDHVLVMSNGGFGGIHDTLLAALARLKRNALRRRSSTCTASARRRQASRRSSSCGPSRRCRRRSGRASTCPHSPPARCRGRVDRRVDRARAGARARAALTLVGSSLGGYYATRPRRALRRARGADQSGGPSLRRPASLRRRRRTNLYTGERFEVTEAHFAELAAMRVARITRPERYFLLRAAGDEVLDWREAVAFYAGACAVRRRRRRPRLDGLRRRDPGGAALRRRAAVDAVGARPATRRLRRNCRRTEAQVRRDAA